MLFKNLLKASPLFFDLLDQEIDKVLKKCAISEFGKGDTIVSEGEVAKDILLLLDGEVIARKELEGVWHDIETFKKGAIFGYLVLVEERKYGSTITAKKEAQVLKIP